MDYKFDKFGAFYKGTKNGFYSWAIAQLVYTGTQIADDLRTNTAADGSTSAYYALLQDRVAALSDAIADCI